MRFKYSLWLKTQTAPSYSALFTLSVAQLLADNVVWTNSPVCDVHMLSMLRLSDRSITLSTSWSSPQRCTFFPLLLPVVTDKTQYPTRPHCSISYQSPPSQQRYQRSFERNRALLPSLCTQLPRIYSGKRSQPFRRTSPTWKSSTFRRRGSAERFGQRVRGDERITERGNLR